MRLAASISLTLSLTACTATSDPTPKTEQAPAKSEVQPEPAKPELELEPAKPELEPAKLEPASFEKRFGGLWVDVGKDVALAPEGGYVLVGRSQRVDDRYSDDYQLAVIVIDGGGEERWKQYLGGEGSYQVGAALVVDAEGMVVVGTTDGEGAGSDDAWVVRLDWSGEQRWAHTLGGAGKDFARDVAAAPDSGVLVLGGTKSSEREQTMAWRLDAEGTLLWTSVLGDTRYDVGSALVPDAGGWTIVGSTTSASADPNDDAWLVQIDDQGKLRGSHAHGGEGQDRLYGLVALEQGWLAVGESNEAGWLVWYDAEGKVVDERRSKPGVLLDVVALPSGWAVGGVVDEGLPGAWLGWVGSDHEQIRARTFQPSRNALEALVATPEGGLMLTGNWATMNSNYANIWACKLDAQGEGC